MTALISLNRADEIINDSDFAEMVEDSEVTEYGVVYTLEDGSTVTVNNDETLTHSA